MPPKTEIEPSQELDHTDLLAEISDAVMAELDQGIRANMPEIVSILGDPQYSNAANEKAWFSGEDGALETTYPNDAIRYVLRDCTTDAIKKAHDVFMQKALPDGSIRRIEAQATVDQFQKMPDDFIPSSVIAIPVAIHDEGLPILERAIEQFARQDGISGSEIVMYANYPYEETTPDTEETAKRNYDNLKNLLSKYPQLNVRLALRGYDPAEPGDMPMMRIRRDLMDAVVLDADQRGLRLDTPVIWMDADTFGLSRNACKALADDAKEQVAPFSRPNLRYTVDSFSASDRPDLTDPEFVIAMDELTRRVVMRNSIDRLDGYLEEHGLTFLLGTYTLAGGIDSAKTVGESAALREGLGSVLGEKRFFTKSNREIHTRSMIIPDSFDELEQFITSAQHVSIKIRELFFASGIKEHLVRPARVYTSARAFTHQLLQEDGKQLPRPRGVSYWDGFQTRGYRNRSHNGTIQHHTGEQTVRMALDPEKWKHNRFGVLTKRQVSQILHKAGLDNE